jgi:hypothetical protein
MVEKENDVFSLEIVMPKQYCEVEHQASVSAGALRMPATNFIVADVQLYGSNNTRRERKTRTPAKTSICAVTSEPLNAMAHSRGLNLTTCDYTGYQC